MAMTVSLDSNYACEADDNSALPLIFNGVLNSFKLVLVFHPKSENVACFASYTFPSVHDVD